MKLSESVLCLAVALSCASSSVNGFQSVSLDRCSTRPSPTARHAIAPPLIIGPMLKKMKDEKAKKNMPMADASESANQAPGLRVGSGSWKWPPVWPYDTALFLPSKQLDEMERKKNMNQLASAVSGIGQSPNMMAPDGATTDGDDDDVEIFKALDFWGKEKGTLETGMDQDAVDKLKEHYSFYLSEDMSILELGAAEDSYLPFKPARLVGVGASEGLMKKNPLLSESMVVDLNDVDKGRDVNNDEFRKLATEPFDAIIMSNTISYLNNPREVLRSAWYLLKPGGVMLISWATQGGCTADFPEAQTKMWTRYNDDQHMWMTGSFFQFSAGDGWESLLGFDISPESAKDATQTGPMAVLAQGKKNNMYVVQATKGYQDDSIDPNDPEKSIKSLCWMLPTMESRDKNLVVPRLARVYQTTENEQVREAIEENISVLPVIFEALLKMDAFSFTFNMQAQLAADLVCDPKFRATDKQIIALKEGLGLRTPGPDFWGPVGKETAAIPVAEKISLLGYIVPRFDSGDAAQEEALQAFVTGLQPTFSVIRSKCPHYSEGDVQLLGAELLAYELLTPGFTTREDFAIWLESMTKEDLSDLLDIRKSYRLAAEEGLANFLQDEEAKKTRREAMIEKMKAQKENARMSRTLIFNPRSQKFETFDNPNLKKK
mmetsp:Transcript_7624/g.9976  ORF Transcript_7624/g.9976 Transcript_7624/m.9976 type:complete len:660 (-) Transcript_7624:86-2065(-)|eukprot:CAMPEP_0198144554 /NCGR_PEP_ID=MMETSP1443-20131203/16432_1 /TAXON_ID=186043 /ORGANISM="Entomoneis sp., Strain CCMP2396" /LENGTH=659 /DNA_ID=CAMNT_0043807961 /DNA_START=89 /DNA_END=2068 /DNA_ORIENTATION=+